MIGSWRGWYMITKGMSGASIYWLIELSMGLKLLIGSIRPLEKKSSEDDGLAYGE